MSKCTHWSHTFLCLILQFQIYIIFNFRTSKIRSRSRTVILSITPFDCKSQIYKCLQHTFALALPISEIKIFKLLPLKSSSRSWSEIFAIKPFDGNCQSPQMFPAHFCNRSYCFRNITFFIFDIQKVGQGHGVQFSQLSYSMANVKIYKCLAYIFALDLTI